MFKALAIRTESYQIRLIICLAVSIYACSGKTDSNTHLKLDLFVDRLRLAQTRDLEGVEPFYRLNKG